jgi:ABC-type nickel/cobalt efflux system permease component RcnA
MNHQPGKAMNKLTRTGLVALLLLALSLAFTARGASAHPMGNFSINQYSALTVGRDKVSIRFVLDEAEIPTFQDLGAIRPDHSTDLTPDQRATLINGKVAGISRNLSLTLGGSHLALHVDRSVLTFPAGSGGLPTTRLEIYYSAPLSGATRGDLEYKNDNFLDRIGWKEVIAVPDSGTMFTGSDVPQTDVTNALTQYSPTAVSSPLDRTAASIQFAPGTSTTAPKVANTTQPDRQGAMDWAKQRIDDVASLISQDNLPLGALLLGLVIAFFWGAGHAMSPGHGKTVVAAYLVGTRGTARHAAILGLTVTVSHTLGVFALGLVVLFAANFIVPDQLYPIIGVLSGGSIVVLGLVMFGQRWRSWRTGKAHEAPASHSHGEHDHPHTHDHDLDHGHDHEHAHDAALSHNHDHDHDMTHTHDHDHSHDHSHDHAHTHPHEDPTVPHSHGPFSKPHTHLPAGEQKMSMKGLLALGITGGIIPCPTALVVLLAAIAYHRVALGLVWILAFSLGLAAVLTGLGLLAVYGRGLMSRRGVSRFRLAGTLMSRLPMASALVVAVLGFLIAIQSLQL